MFDLPGAAGCFVGRGVVCIDLCVVQRLGRARSAHCHHVVGGLLVACKCIALAFARAMVAGRCGGVCVGPMGFVASWFLVELCGGGHVVSHACFCSFIESKHLSDFTALVDKIIDCIAPLIA